MMEDSNIDCGDDEIYFKDDFKEKISTDDEAEEVIAREGTENSNMIPNINRYLSCLNRSP